LPILELNMRTFAALIVLGVVGAATATLAEAWQAKPSLEPGSPPDCKKADISNLFFDLADLLTVTLPKTAEAQKAAKKIEVKEA
jgi:hypothetical protein